MAGVVQSANFSDFKCEIPELSGDNYKVWKERILLHLGWMDIDYAIRKDEPAAITAASTPDEVDLYEKWERSNRLSVMFIKTKISAGIRGSVEQHENVKNLIAAIDEQFVSSDKARASTLIIKFSNMKLTEVRGVRDHIMRMRDIAAQLKSLEEEERLMMEEGEKVNLTVQGKKKKGSAKDKGNIPPQPIIKKESKCFFCKRKGHMKKDCIKFKSWLDKKGYAKPQETGGK
ncbi:unnamed protein product [Trifolium pratense]|uniref:Uncharacterized protein n=1 Tax=Trifolium pratense TaxID=57577 RepID=A0ACB0LFY6_TRIPR|nr:unnamed protein product [Trifolium pratense]